MMRDEKGRRTIGPWGHLTMIICIAVGAFTLDNTDDPAPVREECEPVVWHAGMDMRGWELLLEQGYSDSPGDGLTALYRPGCLP